MRRGYEYCEWCIDQVKKPIKICDKCLPDWQDHEDMLAPDRVKAATVKKFIVECADDVAALKKLVEETAQALRDAEDAVQDRDDQVAQELADVLGIEEVELGKCHKCEHSPTGLCFYDAMNDHCNDSCLMCGHPEERK